MSLSAGQDFYEVLISHPAIYEKYYHQCCWRGLFGSCHWDKTKIVNFAATLGYKFSEQELDQLWFENELVSADDTQKSTVYLARS
jgi:hypothetical protein